jgi:hypothetical protein
MRAHSFLQLTCCIIAAACSSNGGVDPLDEQGVPPGGDVATPFAIDRGDQPGTPGTYKGLWLRLAATGEPTVGAVDGIVGVVCVGMSNGNQECNELILQLAGAWQSEVSAAVRLVNCAVGGHAIERWVDPAYDAALWDSCINTRLQQRGVRLDQVRVIYHKAANQFGSGPGGSALPFYPVAGSDYDNFFANLSAFAARVKQHFPAVAAVYTSSRSYGGFSNRADRGEPLSYEEGHALNGWLASNAVVDGVWYGWGAYLWAPDCASGETNGSAVCYVRSDYQADGVHPTGSGRLKIARMMHDRLRQHAWYRGGP